jgi:predicted transcriptional regulator
MPTTNEQIHDALMVIDSKLRMVDGKVNLIARSNRESMLEALKKVVTARPMIGRIYVSLDGVRNQDEIVAELKQAGVGGSPAAVSRYLSDMQGEHGLVERVADTGRGKTYRKNRELEQILNLTKKIESWLSDIEKNEVKKASSGKASGGKSS